MFNESPIDQELKVLGDNSVSFSTNSHGRNVDDEDEGLIERARSGDQLAWEVLFRRSYPKLMAYASRRLPTEELVKDAVGETMTRAIACIDRFRAEGGGLDAWMYGIARHVVVDMQRTMWREGPGLVPDATDVVEPQPEEPSLRRDDTLAVRSAFARLSSSDQELLELRVVAGLSAEEVGYVLGRRPGAVRMAQSRALERLRSHLSRLGADDGI